MAELAEPFVSFLLERITNLLVAEGQFLQGVKDQADQLQSDLKLMQSLLKDVDAKRDDAAVIREWISQSKDVAYEAENSLETFAFKIASRRRGGIANVLKRYTCIFNECYLRHKIGVEIQTLSTRVSNLTTSFQKYGMKSIMERESSSSSHQQQQKIRRTYSHVEEDDFVGLEDDVKMLVQHLVSEVEVINPFRVVSICGMGGLGKTTIARKVYNHPNVRHHFDGFAWVYISQEWQTKDILQGILVKIIPEKRQEIVNLWREEELVRQLYEVQQNKRCLIVLDDIWSTNVWDCIKYAFPNRDRSKSKMLLTTRNKNVAIHVGPNGFHHEPRLLSHDESWELLRKKALRDRYNTHIGSEDTHRLEELGAEMVNYCKGLPLAIIVLGGILATKHELNEWKFVNQNIKSFLRKSETIGQRGEVEKILALSYDDLPYQLKPCFLYLSTYPEDSDVETETLYHLWMAEGMVSEEHRIGEESMMDVAERYLGELVKRCIVQVKLKEGAAIRKFESCRLHDLMRDICLSKAKDENFLKIVDYREGNNNELLTSTSSSCKLHRLAIFLNEEDVSKYVPPKKEMIEHARSLTFRRLGIGAFDGLMASTQFSNFKMLRALTIEGLCPYGTDKLYDNICICVELFKLEIRNLIHLRYLCLKNTSFGILPSSLGNLEHLETLDVRGFEGFFIRNFLWKMRQLRYLYLPRDDNLFFQCCWKLRLVGLNNLEILVNFNTQFCEVKDLRKLSNLQVLEAIAYEENECEEMVKFVSNSHCLKQASLDFSNCDLAKSDKCTSLVENLFQSNVCHLTLNGYLGMLPAEYKPNFFGNLTELELRKSRIKIDLMGTLEKLPNLQRLWLKDDAFVGTEIICRSTGFPQLRFLSLSGLNSLRKWRVENGAMVNLSRLEISRCEELEKIPDGLRFIAVLKELVIKDMPGEFYDRVRRGGEDFEEVGHIPSIVLPD